MNEIEEWLNSRIGLNFRSGLGRMQQAVALLGNPEQSFPTIHVTGTNGKGSTIAFMRQLFAGHGRKTGSFTSPHMISIHDRICINGQPIAPADFIRLGQEVQKMEQELLKSHDQLSYFEILTLIAFLYFKEQEVDIALIEVGIGGLLDTTNVITGDIAAISSVGLDHQETLGKSLTAIVEQKAGIFKPGRPAVIGPLPEEARLVCEQRSQELRIELYQYGRDFSLTNQTFSNSTMTLSNLELGLKGGYQEENAALALQAFLLFMQQQGWEIDSAKIRTALKETRWAGRLEETSPGIYLDGAHNLPALERLVEFIQSQNDKESLLLFGALKRKDYSTMLAYLRKALPDVQLTVTSFSDGDSLGQADAEGFLYIEDYRQLIQNFQERQNDNQLLFITGSLYFIAEVRAYLTSL
ncbi:bifunctional folylpolyglutamate synthase/dihydrofolate synthase [Streptococcus sanguinis]|uniref:bifunctional folylpolyglutamate synthase/dihydrofolate synthase n=1 Tax=Streptococcus sanguinis TaxID=1305 RepID=UPI001CBAD4F6|nr:folylpolyglutamate synthase/dihydrofolate synthase family protein [Streptococcus sanguinis]MBZ2038621.1 bifunctional folylpolyglutamate synthase/dihydrofolate synthase [Streptococcus sanguinis]MBZ2068426.1 bifunctional folylpolyglutamate synthase/dihydrofolate synthase [Streptococcus sanguinis]MBZ2070890.1 bifunctional folylpolyglutamate synthase/dihydrofolate synthase [Streptococcus sanguinis]